MLIIVFLKYLQYFRINPSEGQIRAILFDCKKKSFQFTYKHFKRCSLYLLEILARIFFYCILSQTRINTFENLSNRDDYSSSFQVSREVRLFCYRKCTFRLAVLFANQRGLNSRSAIEIEMSIFLLFDAQAGCLGSKILSLLGFNNYNYKLE